MKINISIDCTPAEARDMIGLPDVKRIQDKWLDAIEAKILSEAENFTPENMINTWTKGASANMDAVTSLMAKFMQSGQK